LPPSCFLASYAALARGGIAHYVVIVLAGNGQGQVLAGVGLPYQRLSLPKNCIDSAATLELSRQLDAVTVVMPVIE
jgi:hypothetical protein